MSHSRFVRCVAVVAVLSFAVACSKSSPSSSPTGGTSTSPSTTGATATAFASAFCSAASDWSHTIKAKSAQLATNAAAAMSSGGLPKVKQTMTDYIDALRGGTQQLVSQLQQLPDPSVSGGAAAKAALIQAFTQMDAAFSAMEGQINSASVTDPTAFQNAMTSASASLSAAMTKIGSSISSVSNTDLAAAVQADPNCKAIGSGG
jgi:hypothetical protein